MLGFFKREPQEEPEQPNKLDFDTMSDDVLDENIKRTEADIAQAQAELIRNASKEEKLELEVERNFNLMTSKPALLAFGGIAIALAAAGVVSTDIYQEGLEVGVDDPTMLGAGVSMYVMSAGFMALTATGVINRLRNRNTKRRQDSPIKDHSGFWMMNSMPLSDEEPPYETDDRL